MQAKSGDATQANVAIHTTHFAAQILHSGPWSCNLDSAYRPSYSRPLGKLPQLDTTPVMIGVICRPLEMMRDIAWV